MRRANGGLGNERRPAFESGISVVAVVAWCVTCLLLLLLLRPLKSGMIQTRTARPYSVLCGRPWIYATVILWFRTARPGPALLWRQSLLGCRKQLLPTPWPLRPRSGGLVSGRILSTAAVFVGRINRRVNEVAPASNDFVSTWLYGLTRILIGGGVKLR